jgi:hypothetical protein
MANMSEIVFKYSGFRRESSGETERNSVWCPQHFSVEFDLENGVLASWRSDVNAEKIGAAVFYVQSHHCLVGSADAEIQIGNFIVRAELFLISPDGFAALNMTRLLVAGREYSEEYFRAKVPVSLEVDVRGQATIECEAASTLRLRGTEYSFDAGHHEWKIAPLEMPCDWMEAIAHKK